MPAAARLLLLAGRWPAALGALVLVADHLAHLDEAAVQARQVVVQGAVLQKDIQGDYSGCFKPSVDIVLKVVF